VSRDMITQNVSKCVIQQFLVTERRNLLGKFALSISVYIDCELKRTFDMESRFNSMIVGYTTLAAYVVISILNTQFCLSFIKSSHITTDTCGRGRPSWTVSNQRTSQSLSKLWKGEHACVLLCQGLDFEGHLSNWLLLVFTTYDGQRNKLQ